MRLTVHKSDHEGLKLDTMGLDRSLWYKFQIHDDAISSYLDIPVFHVCFSGVWYKLIGWTDFNFQRQPESL
ncbi:hypothetical protein SRHO_G00318150 [Serrasalmus rhombeus]